MIKDEKYLVEGMTCASCVAHVSKAVSKLPGVKEVNVSLLTNSMTVSYEEPTNPHEICEAVKNAGYGAKLSSLEENKKNDDYSSLKEELKDKETPKLLRRLILSLILLVPLFYFGMGYMNVDWHWPLGIIGKNPLMFGLLEGCLALLIMLLNRNFYVSGVKALFHGGPNMDTLVALGSGVAFVYGIAIMFVMSSFVTSSGTDYYKLMHYSMCLTFETAGMVPTLITIGKTLESFSKGKTTNALKSLIDLAPKEAHLLRDGKEITILASDVRKGETFLVRPGESFPVDGIVLNGVSSANESALTGESMPVDKKEGSSVSSGTINLNGSLTCKATNVGNETSLHQIIEMVQNAANSKTKISALADKISGIFVPTILAISLIVFICWLVFGQGVVNALPNDDLLTYAFNRAISVLVIACPCALGLATPVAIMVGSGKGAKNGILFKNALSLEETGKLDFIVLDKTGTITKGNPEVTDIHPFEGVEEETLLQFAYSLENQSEHPLAKAIQKKAKERNLSLLTTTSFETLPGYGIHAIVHDEDVYAGNLKLMEEKGLSNEELIHVCLLFSEKGKTPLIFAKGKTLLGVVAVADEIKEDSKQAIHEFIEMGVTPIMLTGDNEKVAKRIANEAGVTYFVSDLLPNDKLSIIKKLQQYGKVGMVGDGINDAPALTQADVGIAIGAGSDVAIDSGDVVLMKSSLRDAAASLRLSRYTFINIKENLFWAFFYNIIMIPIAAGSLTVIHLNQLKPWYGAAAMALSSVTVCLNALRINLFHPYDEKRCRKHKKVVFPTELFQKETEKGELKMNKTIEIEGMMCEHCVMHVKKALESLPGVTNVTVSLEKKQATLEAKDISNESLKKAIEDAGYQVKDIH